MIKDTDRDNLKVTTHPTVIIPIAIPIILSVHLRWGDEKCERDEKSCGERHVVCFVEIFGGVEEGREND